MFIPWSVCLGVITTVNPAKTIKLIKMTFGRQTCMGPCNHILERSAHWHHLTNTSVQWWCGLTSNHFDYLFNVKTSKMIATDSTQDTGTEMHDTSNIGSTHEHQQGGQVCFTLRSRWIMLFWWQCWTASKTCWMQLLQIHVVASECYTLPVETVSSKGLSLSD